MSFTSLTAVLFLLKSFASLAAVDPNSLVLKDLATLNDASDSSMTSFLKDDQNSPLMASVDEPPANDAVNSLPPPAADVTTFPNDMFRTNDLVASGAAVGSGDPAGTTNPGDYKISDVPSEECLIDPPNARRRVRRGCITLPNIQQSTNQQNPTEVEGARKPEKKTTDKPAMPVTDPGRVRPWYVDQLNLPPAVEPEDHESNPNIKKAEKMEWVCNRLEYGDLNIPMCDSGFGKQVGVPLYFGPDIIWSPPSYNYQYAELLFAHPWVPNFGCVWPEIAWCCERAVVTPPRPDVVLELDHLGRYTAYVCVVYNQGF